MARTLNPVKRRRKRCQETRAHLTEYRDGELDPQTEEGLRRHLRWCPNCGRLFANFSRTLAGLRALREVPTPADEPRRER